MNVLHRLEAELDRQREVADLVLEAPWSRRGSAKALNSSPSVRSAS